MSRAQEITRLCEVSIGATAGIVRTGITAARFKQKMDDKVRQAGLGDKLDKARAERKSALKKRLINPFSKKRKLAHLKASDRVADIKQSGHEKFKQMTTDSSGAAKSELN